MRKKVHDTIASKWPMKAWREKIRKDGLLWTNRGFEYSIYHTLCVNVVVFPFIYWFNVFAYSFCYMRMHLCMAWNTTTSHIIGAYQIIVIGRIFIYGHKWCDNSMETTTGATRTQLITLPRIDSDTHTMFPYRTCWWCGCEESEKGTATFNEFMFCWVQLVNFFFVRFLNVFNILQKLHTSSERWSLHEERYHINSSPSCVGHTCVQTRSLIKWFP